MAPTTEPAPEVPATHTTWRASPMLNPHPVFNVLERGVFLNPERSHEPRPPEEPPHSPATARAVIADFARHQRNLAEIASPLAAMYHAHAAQAVMRYSAERWPVEVPDRPGVRADDGHC